MKKRSGFTLVELLITVVVVSILATVSIASYQTVIEKSKAKVCQQNIKMLTTAVKMYSLENDSLPAALSQVPFKYYKKAYAQVIDNGPKHIRLARKLIKDPILIDNAYAISFEHANFKAYGTTEDAWTCPMDTTGNQSYAINARLAGKKWKLIEKYMPGTPIVGEVERTSSIDPKTFNSLSSLSARHKIGGQEQAHYSTAGGEVKHGAVGGIFLACSHAPAIDNYGEDSNEYLNACRMN